MQKHYEHKDYDAQDVRRLVGLLNLVEPLTDDLRSEIERLLVDERYEGPVKDALADVWAASGEEEVEPEYREMQKQVTLRGIAKKCPGFPLEPQADKSVGRTPLRRRIWLRVAAVMIPLLLLAGAIGLETKDISKGISVETAAVIRHNSDPQSGKEYMPKNMKAAVIQLSAQAEERMVTLPDGSTIKLAAGASLEYKTDFMEKRVVALSGDAFFSVAKQDGNTFEVLYNDMTVRVLGTEFYLTANDNASEVMLCSGSVEIALAGQSIRLVPNQRFVTDLGGEKYSVIDLGKGEMARLLYGKLEFNEITLDKALVQTGEFFGVPIDASGVTANGTIRLSFGVDDTLEDVLFMLQMVSGNAFDYIIEKDRIIIYAR